MLRLTTLVNRIYIYFLWLQLYHTFISFDLFIPPFFILIQFSLLPLYVDLCFMYVCMYVFNIWLCTTQAQLIIYDFELIPIWLYRINIIKDKENINSSDVNVNPMKFQLYSININLEYLHKLSLLISNTQIIERIEFCNFNWTK